MRNVSHLMWIRRTSMSSRFWPLCGAALVALTSGCGAEDAATQSAALTEANRDIGDGEEWIVMQSHLHTTGMHKCSHDPLNPPPGAEGQCYSAEGIEAFLDAALEYGASDMIITDHNSIGAWFDPAFAPKASADRSRYATPLRGTEWSSGGGHLTLFFPRQVAESNAHGHELGIPWDETQAPEDPTPAHYDEIADTVHGHDGLVVINHPKLRFHPFPADTHGADAVEVGVVPKLGIQSTRATRLWWHRRLLDTDRITAMAGSDHHHGDSDVPLVHDPIFGVAVNLIRVDTTLPNVERVEDALANPEATIDMRSDISADAIRRGHVMVIEDLHTPRVYIGADTNDNGLFHDARAGDCVPASAITSGSIRIRVRVTQAAKEGIGGHYNVRFFSHESENHDFYVKLDPENGFANNSRYEIDPDDPFAIELDVPVDAHAAGFFRIELEHDRFARPNVNKTVTNPIYFGRWGAQCGESRPL